MQKLPIKNNIRIKLIDVIIALLFVLLFAALILRVLLSVSYIKYYVIGPSMSGTIEGAKDENTEGGDYVFAYKSHYPRRGDIAVIKTSGKTIIKRVIALEGDTVELKKGVLYLNGEETPESYILKEHNDPLDEYNSFAEITVPKGRMFCMGDNRNVSVDSRSETYGCMPTEWTVGIVADWSMTLKGAVTSVSTFFDFTIRAR